MLVISDRLNDFNAELVEGSSKAKIAEDSTVKMFTESLDLLFPPSVFQNARSAACLLPNFSQAVR